MMPYTATRRLELKMTAQAETKGQKSSLINLARMMVKMAVMTTMTEMRPGKVDEDINKDIYDPK